MTVSLLLFVIAFILFVVAAVGVNAGRVNLIAAGLAFATLAFIIGTVPLR